MKHSNTLRNNNLISLITSDWISGKQKKKKKPAMKTQPLQQSLQIKIQLKVHRSVSCREMVPRLNRQRKHIGYGHICWPYISFLRQNMPYIFYVLLLSHSTSDSIFQEN